MSFFQPTARDEPSHGVGMLGRSQSLVSHGLQGRFQVLPAHPTTSTRLPLLNILQVDWRKLTTTHIATNFNYTLSPF